MATLQQRRKKNIILMVAALVIVVAAYIGISIYQSQKEKAALGLELSSSSADDFVKFVYRRQGEDPVELKKQDGTWINALYPEVPILQDKVQNMAQQMSKVLAKQKLKETDLAAFGLAEPAIILEAIKEDGDKVKLSFGTKNTAGLGYYATFDGGSEIYLLEDPYFDAFNYSSGQLTTVETVRQFTLASVQRLYWKQEDVEMEIVFDKQTDAASRWLISEPYNSQVRVDTAQLTSLLTKMNDMVYAECVEYNCQDFSKYGFDDPTMHMELTWLGSDGNTYNYVMEFGDKTDSNYYYVRTSDSDNVNLYSGTDGKAMMRFTEYDFVYRSLYYGNSANVTSIAVENGGKTYNIERDDFVTVLDNFKEVNIDGEVDTASAGTDNKVCTVTVDESGSGTSVWTFCDYGGQGLYLVDINGKDQSFTVSKRSLETFLDTLE